MSGVFLISLKGFSWLLGEQLGKLAVLVVAVIFLVFLSFIFRIGCGLMRESMVPESCYYFESFENMKALFLKVSDPDEYE